MPKYEVKVSVTRWDIDAANEDEAEYIASSFLFIRGWYEDFPKHKLKVEKVIQYEENK